MSDFFRIEKAIATASGEPAQVISARPCSGGSINEAKLLTLDDGRQFFTKTNTRAEEFKHLFRCEFDALQLLRRSREVRIPAPLAFDDDFIILEAVEFSAPNRCWQEKMGAQLAAFHRASEGVRIGFDEDNYLGLSTQANAPLDEWIDFWRQRRLEHQLKIITRTLGHEDPLIRLGRELSERLEDVLAQDDMSTALLHGDLWAGNAAADESGQPIIFDPASYYGRPEAEFGMMQLFGGFEPRCFAAYNEVWPFEAGAPRRIAVYRLYHEMNHLILFGSQYYQTCLATLKSVL